MDKAEIKPVMQVSELGQKVGRQELLQGVNFSLYPGECLGIFGLRATGKTTLLHILAGVDRFSLGNVQVLGCNLPKEQGFKKHIGLITQMPSLFQDLRVGENLDYIGILKNTYVKNIQPLLQRLELIDYWREPVSLLDAGVYQRLSMACALLGAPQILIADELINDIDLYSRKLILEELKNFIAQGGSCVWAFSNIEFSQYMHRVGWLENGTISILDAKRAKQKWQEQIEALKENSGDKHD